MIRVVLVDDQGIVRAGLARILSIEDGFDVVAQCSDGEQLPDVLAMTPADLITAARAVAAGGAWFDPAMTPRVLTAYRRARLFVALALINRPRVMFLDELTEGLDPAARRDTWGAVARLRGSGVAVVLVTHDMAEAEHPCDRVAVLHDGRIRACGTPAALVAEAGGLRLEGNAVDAAVRSGVDHIVYLSAAGADAPQQAFARWHRQSELKIASSGISWTYPRPNGFMFNVMFAADSIRE